jgi:hypothetical protein
VPLEVFKVGPRSKIAPGASLFGGTVYAAPGALVTYGSLPNDTMTVLKTFTVPGKKKG